METTRRKFFGFMAAVPVGAQQAARTLTQYAGEGSLLSGGDIGDNACPVEASGKELEPWDIYRTVGLPTWKRDEIRAGSTPRRYDPDLEVLRSVSPVSKFRIQHNRNFDREIKELKQGPIIGRLKQAFVKKHNMMWS